MQVLRFQIRTPQGTVDQLSVEGERVLIGSGAHCEIRLPVDQARVEHVAVEASAAGVFVRALSFEPPPTINQIPFTQGPLPPEAVLGVGQTQIMVALGDHNAGDALVTQKKKGTSPITLVAMLIMVPAALWLFLSDDEVHPGRNIPKDAPELWAEAPAGPCPEKGPQALAWARERVVLADAKRERRPFHVQDGIQSVPLYELSAACFRVGGDAPAAQMADENAKYLRLDINNDYRTQRVRLEHSLSIEDWQAALKNVKLLMQYTDGKQGEYVLWLAGAERRLRARISQQQTQQGQPPATGGGK